MRGEGGHAGDYRVPLGSRHLPAAGGAGDFYTVLDPFHAFSRGDSLLGHLLEVVRRQAASQDQHAVVPVTGDVLQHQIRVGT